MTKDYHRKYKAKRQELYIGRVFCTWTLHMTQNCRCIFENPDAKSALIKGNVCVGVCACQCVSSKTPKPWNLAAWNFACTLRKLQGSAKVKIGCLG